MTQFINVLELINFGLVTVYGFLLSIAFSGGFRDSRQRYTAYSLLLMFLLLQIPCRLTLGVEFTRKLYPFLVHIPLVLILTLGLEKNIGVSVVSVCTAYCCCQFPRWASLVLSAALPEPAKHTAEVILYTIVIFPIFLLLYRRFSKYAYMAMTYSKRSLLLFGTLPAVYYIFDYAAAIYTKILYSGGYAVSEAVPTVAILFYVGFISLYHAEVQKRTGTEFEKAALSMELKQAETEITAMKMLDEQNAVFRHDMRHHINLILTYIENNDAESAAEYIKQIRNNLHEITPTVYTENNIVNYALTYFSIKAKEKGVAFKCTANVPKRLNIPDTDLSAVLSNVLENAVTAAEKCAGEVEVIIKVSKNKLLISVENPYSGVIESEGELPVNHEDGHGFGIKSIRAIAERNNGTCLFEWGNNMFKTRIVMEM